MFKAIQKSKGFFQNNVINPNSYTLPSYSFVNVVSTANLVYDIKLEDYTEENQKKV